ncbi:acyl carrier protein [Pseudonocardia sp. HH130630-07]|uniref:acyl carrier protein n=1 Tax=Pseudonocardia sp. HH130630-07 TaxID=1690815 RepID=UPI000814D453|nr:acyl carrier protein [Pseudonocardia sp. HH130630-07]ANY07820.1 coronafacic acid synthetase [Pseudonocardia sp. HH130630-07]
MTTVDTIKDTLVSAVFVEVAPADMGLDDSMRDVFGLDSLGFVELRAQCEEVFGIEIGDDDFTPENFATIRSLAGLVERRTAAVGSGG